MEKIAVVGVQESSGREILTLLSEDGVKVSDVIALDIHAPIGTMVSYGEEEDIDVTNLEGFDFSKVKAAIFATTAEIAKRHIPKALSCGIKVVDASGAFSSDSDVPMLIAGVNNSKISLAKKGLVSIPSADVTQMLMPLQGVDEKYKIKRIVMTSYTSTSIYGRAAMDELFSQTKKIFMNESLVEHQKVFHKQIAFNLIPQVGEFIGEETSYEWAVNVETKKVLRPEVKVHANFAVVPAFVGSAQYVNVECAEDIDVDDIKQLMNTTKGVVVFDKKVDGGYVTLADVQGENDVYVSRLRQDVSVENGISFWCVADNLRVGVAKNAFSVLKLLLQDKN